MRSVRLIGVPILGVFTIIGSAGADQVSLDEAFEGADSICGAPRGLTAIQRLPPVRIVAFDPVSNSFAFVACEPDKTPEGKIEVSNQDFLDRRRLALSTQKIRLLVLPYNPADGDLILEKADGEGVEFEEISGGAFPSQASTSAKEKAKTESQEAKPEEKPKEPTIKDPGLLEKVRPLTKELDLKIDKEEDSALQFRSAYEEVTDRKDPATYTLAILNRMAEDYSFGSGEILRDLQFLNENERCIRASLKAAPVEFTQKLAENQRPLFSMARDVTLSELRRESARRLDLITKDFYKPCGLDKGASPADFSSDVRAFDSSAARIANGIAGLKSLIREMSFILRGLKAQPRPKGISKEAWKAELDSFEDFILQAEDFNTSMATDLSRSMESSDQFRVDNDTFRKALSSPALQIQRFNYSPLPNGKSVAFTISRGKKQPDDGTAVPTRVNSLEIKSAPVYTVRFGTGLVASHLDNPTFKVADFPIQGGNATDKQTVILFDDRSNGRVLPGLFLHHYWGRKSPLLQRTAFEMWTPTLSLGIPMSEANLFSQFFLGLDWELMTGFELNVGYHFGKVNALAREIRVGEALPVGVDASSVQEKKFDSAVYFGIVVNRDAFDRIFKNGENGT